MNGNQNISAADFWRNVAAGNFPNVPGASCPPVAQLAVPTGSCAAPAPVGPTGPFTGIDLMKLIGNRCGETQIYFTNNASNSVKVDLGISPCAFEARRYIDLDTNTWFEESTTFVTPNAPFTATTGVGGEAFTSFNCFNHMTSIVSEVRFRGSDASIALMAAEDLLIWSIDHTNNFKTCVNKVQINPCTPCVESVAGQNTIVWNAGLTPISPNTGLGISIPAATAGTLTFCFAGVERVRNITDCGFPVLPCPAPGYAVRA